MTEIDNRAAEAPQTQPALTRDELFRQLSEARWTTQTRDGRFYSVHSRGSVSVTIDVPQDASPAYLEHMRSTLVDLGLDDDLAAYRARTAERRSRQERPEPMDLVWIMYRIGRAGWHAARADSGHGYLLTTREGYLLAVDLDPAASAAEQQRLADLLAEYGLGVDDQRARQASQTFAQWAASLGREQYQLAYALVCQMVFDTGKPERDAMPMGQLRELVMRAHRAAHAATGAGTRR